MDRGWMEAGGGLLGLLRLEQVQKELNLSDQQKEKLKGLGREARPERPADGGDLTPEERQQKLDEFRKKARERMEKIEKRLAEILKPEQLERLKQIRLQATGAAALADPQVVKALGITDDQRAKLKKLYDGAGEKRRELRGSMRDLSPDEREAKRAENQKKIRQIEKELMDKALEVLTPEQREKFEKMKGKKFDLDFSALVPPRQPNRPGRGRTD
jgi:Spy/CpxP family protein refolding chaperone